MSAIRRVLELENALAGIKSLLATIMEKRHLGSQAHHDLGTIIEIIGGILNERESE